MERKKKKLSKQNCAHRKEILKILSQPTLSIITHSISPMLKLFYMKKKRITNKTTTIFSFIYNMNNFCHSPTTILCVVVAGRHNHRMLLFIPLCFYFIYFFIFHFHFFFCVSLRQNVNASTCVNKYLGQLNKQKQRTERAK